MTWWLWLLVGVAAGIVAELKFGRYVVRRLHKHSDLYRGVLKSLGNDELVELSKRTTAELERRKDALA